MADIPDGWVTCVDLARELGIDAHAAVEIARGMGYVFPSAPNIPEEKFIMGPSQATDIRRAYKSWQRVSLRPAKKPGRKKGTNPTPEWGVFYIALPIPEVDMRRIKVGFSGSYQQRLATYRSICPCAEMIGLWHCQASWEKTAIMAITRDGCEQLSNSEVYRCTGLDAIILVLQHANAFFTGLPPRKDAAHDDKFCGIDKVRELWVEHEWPFGLPDESDVS